MTKLATKEDVYIHFTKLELVCKTEVECRQTVTDHNLIVSIVDFTITIFGQ
ncbi:MAG: hypothetical protein R3B47_11615 [Bacteroidia bacterium]